jgi:hypothetical protein
MTDRLDQLNAGIQKMFPFCHAVLYAIMGTFFHASAVVTRPSHAASRARKTAKKTLAVHGRQYWLSNRVFKSFDDTVDHCC